MAMACKASWRSAALPDFAACTTPSMMARPTQAIAAGNSPITTVTAHSSDAARGWASHTQRRDWGNWARSWRIDTRGLAAADDTAAP